MRKYILLLLPALAVASVAVAASPSVKGRVTDQNGEPLVGASIFWANTTVGQTVDGEGNFTIHRVKGYDKLVATYMGYVSDTLNVANINSAAFALASQSVEMDAVVVEGNMSGNYIKRDGIVKNEMISFAGLCKMACCSLAESFENSASVTVGYSDAISGARQIKMLGLAGTYTQILDENRPIMRGLGAPYGLSYTPGMWLNSIQVSKGISSVKSGHEAITGQINLEHRKPTDEERLFVNAYFDSELRPELNISTAMPVSKDKKLSTVLLLHGSMDTQGHDMNKDGFYDLPLGRQVNVANRWSYLADNGLQVRWGGKFVEERRLGGMKKFTDSMRDMNRQERDKTMVDNNIYGSQLNNREGNAYFKIGAPVGSGVYSEEDGDEMRSNIAFIADYDYFKADSYFGLNNFKGIENSTSFDLMYSHYFSYRNSLIVGASGQYKMFDEKLDNGILSNGGGATPTIDVKTFDMSRNEAEAGLYAEYTFAIKDKFSIIAGLRGDYNTYYDKVYVTPRAHLKWNITPTTTLRASGGMGYRSTNVITDNIGILATGRQIVFEKGYNSGFNRMEEALTFGGSITQSWDMLGDNNATLSFDYFRTQFFNMVVVDQERDANSIYIYDTRKSSATNTYQLDFSWTPIERFDVFATFRYTDSNIQLKDAAGEYYTTERPLVSRYKALINLQYATRFRRWVFDVTAQLNGPSRLPDVYGVSGKESPIYPMLFAQVSYKIKKVDIYAGCENILGYMQENPILDAANPFSNNFNSSVVWGPLMGRKFYVGLRFNLY